MRVCEFFSGVMSRTGKVYHLGEIVSHEKIIRKFKLKDRWSDIARFEIIPKNELDYLKPIDERYWKFKIDEEAEPSWWNKEKEFKCWNAFEKWMKSQEGKDFRRKFRKIMKWKEKMEKKTDEQHIYATKLNPRVKKLIKEYYYKRRNWYLVRDSVWDSVSNSVWDLVKNSVWDSVSDSVGILVKKSIWDLFTYNFGILCNSKEAMKLKLPVDIFKAGVVHAAINNDIMVWGKKGKLLDRWDVKEVLI